ncbi:MAG: OmpA family protein [Gammaproteobacteria bacterium]|nr:OmpA family protein [Gammaproteobacteria bacterium]
MKLKQKMKGESALGLILAIVAVAAIVWALYDKGALRYDGESEKFLAAKAELQKASVEIDGLTAQLDDKMNAISSIKTELDAAKTQWAQTKAKLAEKEGIIQTIQGALDRAEMGWEQAKDQIKAQTEEIGRLSTELSEKTQQVETLTATLDEKTAEIQSLGVEISNKTKALFESNASIDALKTNLADAEVALSEAAEQTVDLGTVLDSNEVKAAIDEALGDQAAQFNADIAALQTAHQSALQALDEEWQAKLNSASAELEGKLSALTAERDALNEEWAQKLAEANDALTAKVAASSPEGEVVVKPQNDETLQALRLERDQMAEQVRELQRSETALVEAHQREIADLSAALEELSGKQEVNQEQAAELAAELEAAGQRIDEYRQALAQREVRTSELRGLLDQSLSKVGLSGQLNQEVGDLIAFPLSNTLLFRSGSAVITDQGRQLLSDLGQVLAGFAEFDIVVEGHTDDQPLLGQGNKTNWELSTERAVAAVREIERLGGVDSARLSAVGFGEYRPVADNETAEGRAANRRVELRIQARP